MRRTGKDYWHEEPSLGARIPRAAYVLLGITAVVSAMAIGFSNREHTPPLANNTPAATTPSVATPAEPPNLLPSLYNKVSVAPHTNTSSEPQAKPASIIEQITPVTDAQATATEPMFWKALKVKSGDSFSSLMERAGFSTQAWFEVVNLGAPTKALTQLRVGDTVNVVEHDGRVAALDYKLDIENTLQVRRNQAGLHVKTHTVPLERRTVSSVGKIENAFYIAAQNADLPDNIIMELADLFAWDINFALDIRSGDTFSVLYEETYQQGKRIGTGNILAAEFINKGKTYRTVRYTDPKGKTNYYTPEGRSMRRAFLRSPVHFTRISSRFNPNRLHPIYKTKRPHRGVDYAAPRGTPIMSSGDGVVTFAGTQTGYGKVVIIKHGERYSTLYAHMNRIGKGMRRGKRVKQGQTIGTVGSTGWATGPHLHYEFRVDGAHRNPLTVKLPLAEPIEKQFRRDFDEHSGPMMAWLDALGQTQLAYSHHQH